MRTRRSRWPGAVGLGVALGLMLAGAAAPSPAVAGDVRIASHRSEGSGGQWSGEHRRMSPGPQWRQDHGRHDYWGHQNDHGRQGYRGHSGYWPHRYDYGYGWWGAPVYVPGRWIWNGWDWVWAPGYWR